MKIKKAFISLSILLGLNLLISFGTHHAQGALQMEDVWFTFPAQMGDHQAWITYNHGYSEIADSDSRNILFSAKIVFKNPTEYGMPTNEEFPHIAAVDEKLDKYVTEKNGIYLGRITADGSRYFYFYVNFDQAEAEKIIKKVSSETDYKIQYLIKKDLDKSEYWERLFPTQDDWQVIQDLKVLDSLAENGDNRDKERIVEHWAYFKSKESAAEFRGWALEKGYKISSFGPTEDKKSILVQYTHIGTMNLYDITNHTITSNRKARELKGEYDGWETSVEKD